METSSEDSARRAKRALLVRHASVVRRRASRLPPVVRGLMWSAAAGLLFSILNTVMRKLAMELSAFETQFLRYVASLVVMLPLVAHAGMSSYMPKNVIGQFTRGGVHTIGLVLWFWALPYIGLADTTAIAFTGPIFIMIGASWFFGEKMRWDRWVAALFGIAGVAIVVAPKLGGEGGIYNLVMLASVPVFAASFLITKALTRHERTTVIVVWQSITISIFSLPLALLAWQWPTAWQWIAFLFCGLIGAAGHYCLTQSFGVADISATQSVKFLDLVWASIMGFLVFSDIPSQSTIIGGIVISASTIWIARREARSRIR
ncbi:EamA family transporter [Caenimonas koreensis DSM 17982]|uniref:EamA family transporter n=1 Tax=Caenimonas koreensis DSM 17982 TaxID=1121255 RepID=A0A844BBP9_9BURK|nr:DMT family transporter [Caenimonas koreensis]MRD48867.1 EamA family transporter [Caenimonas koreensis DSM 17982]